MKRLATLTFIATGLVSLPTYAAQYVCMESTQGDFCMQLFEAAAPRTVSNFLNYVSAGDFNSSLIHRSGVTPDGQKFVIQGGGYVLKNGNMLEPIVTAGPIANEFSRSNQRGTVAMAKLGNDPNSATSQWYINLRDNADNLDTINGGYTVFAEIVTGMEVVDAIANLPRADFIYSLNDASLGEVPVDAPPGFTSVAPEELVLVTHAYVLDQLPSPYHCRLDSPQDALAEFCAGTITLPVMIDGIAYSATLNLAALSPTLELTADRASLKVLSPAPAGLAQFDAATKTLHIPSVRNGDNVFHDVVLNLIDQPSLRFSLSSFTKL